VKHETFIVHVLAGRDDDHDRNCFRGKISISQTAHRWLQFGVPQEQRLHQHAMPELRTFLSQWCRSIGLVSRFLIQQAPPVCHGVPEAAESNIFGHRAPAICWLVGY
jgi:hypothetical protein